MLELRIETNIPEVVDELARFTREGLPRSRALLLDDLGERAAERQREGMLARWDVQEPEWLRGTIQVERDGEDVAVTVTDARIAEHEEGALRTAGGPVQRSLLRPISELARSRPIQGGNTPRAVLLEGGFLAKLPSGRTGVFKRSRGQRRAELVFVLDRQVNVPDDLLLGVTVQDSVERGAVDAFERAFAAVAEDLTLLEPLDASVF